MEEFPMKWTLKLERIDAAGILQSAVVCQRRRQIVPNGGVKVYRSS